MTSLSSLIYIVKNCLLQKLIVAASAFSFSSVPFFQKLTPCSYISFRLKSFLWKCPLTVKVKKIIDQILVYSSFRFAIRVHLGHLFA